ncbi:hypothetical protein Q5530_12700 [Saccharothrix sp. BKS2]|uniref:hypothetical protein n=1 Tax=Saccharothrix sp. BKS2 TaxID=3064400 RepID=UPI0039E800F2
MTTGIADALGRIAPPGGLVCALWAEGDDLDGAAARTARLTRDAAGVGPDSRVLDLGGPAVAEALRSAPADAAFDAVVSVHGLEHLATPRQRDRGEHLALLRAFFRSVHRLAAPGAVFAVHTTTANRLPRRPGPALALARVSRALPLWSLCWRTEEIVKACGGAWEVRTVDTHRRDAVRTVHAWLHRLRATGPAIDGEHEDLLRTCAQAFEDSHLTLTRLTLHRVD